MRKLFTLLFVLVVYAGMFSKAYATTCAQAVAIPATPTFPWVSVPVCGLTDDITSANATVCGSGSYLGGLEAVYSWTPSYDYTNVTFAYTGQTWIGLFLYQGCPTAGGICIANYTTSASSVTLAYVGTNLTSGTPISLSTGVTYYLVVDTWPSPPSPCPGTITINGVINVPCIAPTAAPTALVLTPVLYSSNKISGSFTAAPSTDGYLVVRYPSGAAVTDPVKGTTYTVGAALGLGTVAASSALTTFTATGLTASTTYDFYIYSYNNLSCSPITYFGTPLSGSATTNSIQNVSSTATGGLWSSPATWVGGSVPANDHAIIASGAIVTVDQIVAVKDLTISGILQWGSTSYVLTATGNVLINSGGSFLPHTTGQTGQTVDVGGNLTNNGFANFALSSTILNFKGSQIGGSLNQTLAGTGTFAGDGTNGIIRILWFQSNLGTYTVSTTQNIITSNLAPTAGTLNTGGKLIVDNTAQLYGQALNRQVANVAVTNMGVAYTNAPVVFGAAVLPWAASTLLTVNSRYFYGNNVYLCTTAGTTDVTPPTSTASTTFTDGTATLLYIGTLGTIGNPFIQTALTVGTQYFYGGNLYVAVATTAPGATPPTHTSGTNSTSFLYIGTPAQVSVNYDGTTQTVRSLTLTSPGTGYVTSAPTIVFSLNGGTVTTAAVASAVLIQQVAGPASSITQKGTVTVINGGLTIVSNQAVGGISTTNGGVNYSTAPSVGFSLPTGFLNLVTAGGSGYTSAPTITVSDGTSLTGSTNPTFTTVVANGQVVSVICTGGGTLWTTPPTLAVTGGGGSGATCAFPTSPSSCLPTATATITNGTITGFTITNAGFGYASAPTLGLVGGTPTTAATTPSCRIGLYNLAMAYYTPATSNPAFTEGSEVPLNRRINAINFAPGVTGTYTGNLEIYASSPILTTLTNAGVPDFGSNTVTFSHPSYAGQAGSATFGFNGNVTLTTPGGSLTRTFPFDAAFAVATGTGSLATGSNITSITASRTAAPSGTGNPIGTRAYRLQRNGGAIFGTNPTVTLNYNANDALITDVQSLFISQSTSVGGPWTVRSLTSGTGVLPVTGSRTTATAAPGPINSDEYFAWSSTYIPPPPLSFDIVRTTGDPLTSIMSTGTTYTWNGTSNDDNTTTTVAIPSSTFMFQGQLITGFNVCTNGWIKLVSAASGATTLTTYQNTFGGGAIPMILAPFFDDLTTNPNSGGVTTLNATTRYQIIGSTPGTRQIIAEWYNYTVFGAAGPQLTFQIVLDETDNSIKYNYGLFQGFNGTNNHRYTYSCGIGGRFVNSLFPQPGEVLAQQYENTAGFSNQFTSVISAGANGLMSIPECNSSIKFTPGTYAGFTPPVPAAPANDEYTGAITVPALTSFPSNLCGNFYTSRNATPSAQTVCAGNADDDVWFKFTANQTATTVRVYGSGGYIPRVEVLDNTLTPLASPVCVVGSAGGTFVDAVLTGITIGNLYYVRVYHDGGGTQATAAAVLSGTAVGSVTITNGGTGYTSTTSGSYLTARVRFTGGGGSGAVGTVVLTGNSVSSVSVLSGGYGYTSAPTVTIESPSWAHIGEFAIVVYAPAVNDNCAGAIALTGLTTPGCNNGSNSVTDNTQSATPSAEATVCGLPDDDVWYKFTAVNANTSVTLSGTGTFDPAFEIFDGGASPGSCGSKTSLVCVNSTGAGATESVVQPTTIGNTYYVRVYHAGTGTAINETFTLCVSSAVPACISAPTSPTNGGSVCPGTVNLSWPAMAGVTGYDVYLDAGTSAVTNVSPNQAGTSYTTPTALSAGPYAWKVVPKNSFGDATGCATFTFTVNTPPELEISPKNADFCPGGTPVTITASGAVTYSWSPSAGLNVTTGPTVIASPSGTTTYTVTGFDGAGCSGTATCTITVNPVITATATVTPPSVCQYGSSVLTATASVAGLTYCVPAQTGSACVTGVTFNTLTSTPAACVTPYYRINPATGANTTSVTQGSSYSLTVTAVESAIVSVWIDYNNDGTFEASEWNQVYTTGTTGTISITIPSGAANALTGMRIRSRLTGNPNGSGDACTSFGSGSTEDYWITIGTPPTLSGVTYTWSPATYLSSTTGTPVTASNIAGTITYTLTAAADGYCSGTANATVTISPLVCGALTTGGATPCVGVQTVIANPSGGATPYGYVWAEDGNPIGGNTASIITSLGTHTYSCTVTDGCSNSCSSSLAVTTYAIPTVGVTPATATYCLPGGTPVQLTASGASTYSWSPATGLDVTTGAVVNASPVSGTTYTVTGIANGCSNTSTATVTVAPAVTMGSVTATPPSIPNLGSSVLSASATVASSYCIPTVTSGGQTEDYLNNFTFADLTNNNSGDALSDYTYYSALPPANVVADGATSYNISCTPGGTTYSQQFRIWIDFNQNGTFEESESVFSTTTAVTGPSSATGTTTIPNTAYNGITRMRVACRYSSVVVATASCVNSGYGEFEDYNVSITGGQTAPPVSIIYTWSPATFLSSTTGSTVTASNVTATTTYTVTASTGGCSASGNVTVTVTGPPENLTVSGTVGTGQSNCYNATSTITVAESAPFTIESGGSAEFIAGVKILFKPGTTVQSGGYMWGHIAPGGPWCPGPTAPVVVTGTGPEQSTLSFTGFTLYPNPTNGNFILAQKGDKTYGTVKVEVYSMSGTKVMTERMIGEKQHEFRFAEMPTGLYFVKVVADDYVETIKLVKTR